MSATTANGFVEEHHLLETEVRLRGRWHEMGGEHIDPSGAGSAAEVQLWMLKWHHVDRNHYSERS
jgi:hypothetical protein